MGEVEERRPMRFDIVQRQDIGIDVGDLPVAVRHPVPQDAFCPNPVEFPGFLNHRCNLDSYGDGCFIGNDLVTQAPHFYIQSPSCQRLYDKYTQFLTNNQISICCFSVCCGLERPGADIGYRMFRVLLTCRIHIQHT